MRRMLCASRNDDYSVASVHGRPSARPIALLPLLFAVLDLLVLLDQAKSTEEKMHDRRNRFLLREVSRTSDWAFPARSGFTTFCHRKVAPKVSAEHLRRDRTEQCGICGALRATMIICWSPVLAGLRPAGSHCEKSGKIPTLHCIPFGTTNPVILRRKSKPIPTQTSPPALPRKQRRKRPCPIGFRHICPKTEK